MTSTGLPIQDAPRSGPAPAPARTPAPAWLPAPAFAALALEWLLLCTLVGCLAVHLVTRPASPAEIRPPRWELAVGQLILVLLAVGAAAWPLQRAARGGRAKAVLVLSATAVVYALGVVGLKAVEWAAWGEPHVIVVEPPRSAAPAAAPTAAPKATGDKAAGGRVFASSCAACHGAAGEGVPQVAPALVGSPFVNDASDSAVAHVIINGRAPNDPASKTGKAMPARGGNPFLTDAEVADIVAFLRGGADGVAAGAAPKAAAGPHRWVVPAAARPQVGRGPLLEPAPAAPALPIEIATLQHSPAERSFGGFVLILSGLHALHVLVGAALAVALMWRASTRPHRLIELAAFHRFHWILGLAMWTVLIPLLYARW